jgi:MFS family permease
MLIPSTLTILLSPIHPLASIATMAERYSDPAWPPGTVKIQQLLSNSNNSHKDARIILQPRPTDDPNDPLNWPKKQKILNYSLACYYAMMVFAFVNATSPTWGPMGDELGFSSQTLTNTYAIGCATLSLGAPMLIPFALKYGSRPVYVLSSVAQFAISIWAARTMTAGDWWGVNALQCWLGALAEVLIQMTVADMFFVHQRGLMNTIYIWANNVGSNLAVVAAGFITDGQGWRWVWWWCAIFFGVQFLMFFFGFEETKFAVPIVIDGRRGSAPEMVQDLKMKEKDEKQASATPVTPTSDIEAATSNDQDATGTLSVVHINPDIKRKSYWQKLSLLQTTPGPWSHFLRHSYQPFMILVSIPGVAFSSLTYAILLAFSTVMTTALSTYMLDPPYNFSASEIGLMSLAPFIGSTLGSIIVGPLSDYVALRLSKRNKGVYEPEFRFYCFLPFVPFQCGGAWYFAYALADGRHWAHVAVAYGICNFGSAPLQSLALTYMLDAYNGNSRILRWSENVRQILTHLQRLLEILSPHLPSCVTCSARSSSSLCQLGLLR